MLPSMYENFFQMWNGTKHFSEAPVMSNSFSICRPEFPTSVLWVAKSWTAEFSWVSQERLHLVVMNTRAACAHWFTSDETTPSRDDKASLLWALVLQDCLSINKGPSMSDCKSPHLTTLDSGCLLRALLTVCLDFPALQMLRTFQEVLGRQIAAAGERLLLSVSVLQIS